MQPQGNAPRYARITEQEPESAPQKRKTLQNRKRRSAAARDDSDDLGGAKWSVGPRHRIAPHDHVPVFRQSEHTMQEKPAVPECQGEIAALELG